MKLTKKQKKSLCILLILLVLFLLYRFVLTPKTQPADSDISSVISSSVQSSSAESEGSATGGDLQVHFFDVDQADSILFITPDGYTMLIDAGDSGTKYDLLDKLQTLDISTIDVLIATHPHSDHIGGMQVVVENFEIKNFYLPNAEHTSKTYLKLLDAVTERESIAVHQAKDGITFDLGQYVSCEMLGPVKDYEDLNDSSAVVRVTYGDISFMMTGDAEIPAETDMLMANDAADFKSTVLKMGHHGSDTSSGNPFLDAVDPQYAIISCGIDNDYGHPNALTLEHLAERKIPTYRTDMLGDIVATTDGKQITFNKPGQIPDVETEILKYVYVTDNGKTYHRENCSSLSKSKNRITMEQAKENNFTPCKRCFD